MAKREYFIPGSDNDKVVWLNNLATKLPTYAAALGFTSAETAPLIQDAAYFAFVVDALNKYKPKMQQITTYKNILRDGPASASIGAFPSAPTLLTMPTVVLAGIFARAAALVRRIKSHPAFTAAMGEDLGIIGDELTVDLNAIKPLIQIRFMAGKPEVVWEKQSMTALEIEVDRGSGFAFLTIDSEPNYIDTFALPAAGQSAVWKYRAIYRLRDERVGQWSDVASVSVMGA